MSWPLCFMCANQKFVHLIASIELLKSGKVSWSADQYSLYFCGWLMQGHAASRTNTLRYAGWSSPTYNRSSSRIYANPSIPTARLSSSGVQPCLPKTLSKVSDTRELMQDYLLLLTSLTRPTHASAAGTACSVEERSTAAYHLPRTKETKSELQTI